MKKKLFKWALRRSPNNLTKFLVGAAYGLWELEGAGSALMIIRRAFKEGNDHARPKR
ncbi:MAG: hypothetical protein KGJ13_06100 [Patescibacteria group bacterium]|nr:hypothetical protein [Patescibacteria group bacterium]